MARHQPQGSLNQVLLTTLEFAWAATCLWFSFKAAKQEWVMMQMGDQMLEFKVQLPLQEKTRCINSAEEDD